MATRQLGITTRYSGNGAEQWDILSIALKPFLRNRLRLVLSCALIPRTTTLRMVSACNPAIRFLGPFLLGVVVALALYGVVVAQLCHYLRRTVYVKPWLKCLTDLEYLGHSNPAEPLEAKSFMGQGLVAFTAQLFFVWTVHVVIRTRLLTYTIFFFAASGLVACIVFGIESISLPQYSQWRKLDGAIATWLASALLADTLAALSLARYLGKRRCSTFSLGDAASRFISMSLATGIVTSLASIVCLATFVANGPHMAFDFMLSKLYMNAVLSMLNSPSYEDLDNSENSSIGGLQLTSIALDAP
ncbi:hypothetical protein FIBSPDRAFT_883192 [Athelia psychrophila]|uniref:DUF6534 domain-containing protein n=1 Tax=Athelia psychrophila TaxID=1759441 RepID=A0A166UNJ1_9AGAM|nr:hypothetical protein FIBSPDRAFT_883192 [Fibularhizoctonia sp. CBS 109695]